MNYIDRNDDAKYLIFINIVDNDLISISSFDCFLR